MDSNLIANIEDQIEILSLRIEKLKKQFDNLDKVVCDYPIINFSGTNRRQEVNIRSDHERCIESKY